MHRLSILCFVVCVGCARTPEQASTVPDPRLAALEAENAQLRAEVIKARTASVVKPAPVENQVRPRPPEVKQPPALKPSLPELKIISPATTQSAAAKLVYLGAAQLEIGQVGYLAADARLDTYMQVRSIISDEYMAVCFEDRTDRPLVLYYLTTGLVTGKKLPITGVWKVVGTCKHLGATRHVLHMVAAK